MSSSHGMRAMTLADCTTTFQAKKAIQIPVIRERGCYHTNPVRAPFQTHMPGKLGMRRSSHAVAALQIDEPPTYEEVRQEAEAAFQRAASLLPLSEEAEKLARLKQAAVNLALRDAEVAERKAAELGPRAEAALREARAAAAALQGQHEEISSADLLSLAAHMLETWTDSQTDAVTIQGSYDTQVSMGGVEDAVVTARVAAAEVGGNRFAVAALAIGERFPEGALEGTVLHWACNSRPRGGWDPPPPGWHTLPPVSFPAGKAWQTPFATYAPVIRGRTVASDLAYGLVLQIPFEGILSRGGGLAFVLKRADGKQPQWIQSEGNRDFSISFEQVYKYFEKSDGTGMNQKALDMQQSRVEGWNAQEGSSATPQTRTPAANGPLKQQYQAAVAFLQEVFSKSEDQGSAGSIKADYTAAKEALVGANQLIQDADIARQHALETRERANQLQREAKEAEHRVQGLHIDAKTAMRAARASAARLAGKEQEVGLVELHAIAEARLKEWMNWAASRRKWQSPEEGDAEDGESSHGLHSFRLHGLDGWLASCATICHEGGKDYAVISLAAAESFPEGVLDGVVAHWGCAGVGRRGGWETPPAGWTSDATDSHEAGGGATESRLERVEVPGYKGRKEVAAHALTLQLPLEGPVGKGGVKLVLRTVDQQWLGCSYQGSRHDIFISLQQFGDALEAAKEASKPVKKDETISSSEAQAAEAKLPTEDAPRPKELPSANDT